jgi:hypothetical protein
MPEPTNQGSKKLDNITSVVTSRRSRSLVFVVITFLLILVANGLLPLISGQAHYTANAIEVTYDEYLAMKEDNELIDLTYGAKVKISLYKDLYKLTNPDLTPEEELLLEPPGDLKVDVYTVFFFQSQWWYFNTGISLLSAVFLFYAMFNYLVVRSKDTNVDHVNGESTIRQLNEKYLDPDTFEPWIERVFNLERKKRQHIRNTKFELRKLENKTPYEVRRRFKKYFKTEGILDIDENNLLPVPYQEMSKEETAYINKKEELLTMLTEEYIQDYVVDNDVKNFREIKPGFVYSGINNEAVGQDEYSAIKTDAQRIRGSMLSKIIMSLSVTLAFASVLTVLAINVEEQNPLWLAVTILMKIVPLLLQVYFAIDYNNWFMDHQLLPNLKFRENIAMKYLAQMKRDGTLNENIVINKIEVINERGGHK